MDLAGRLSGRVQITTDGHCAHLSAVEDAFGTEVDLRFSRSSFRELAHYRLGRSLALSFPLCSAHKMSFGLKPVEIKRDAFDYSQLEG